MLDWSLVDLARVAAVSVSAVRRIEHGEPDRMPYDSHAKVRHAFECEGIVFLIDGDEGIVLKHRAKIRSMPAPAMAKVALPT